VNHCVGYRQNLSFGTPIEQGWKKASGSFETQNIAPSDGQVHGVIFPQHLEFNCVL